MSDLLEAMRTHSPLPDWAPPLPRGPYPTATYPAGLTHLPQPADKYAPPPCHPDCERIEFASYCLEGEIVTADVVVDMEPLHYQHGTVPGTVEVCALYVRGFNIGMYADRITLNELDREAEAHVWRMAKGRA